MDYSKPIDAELFPEGCERCSLTKFMGWMAFLGVIFLWGLYAAVRILGLGLGETGMDDYFGFGLWITFDLAVIALGAGAFFTMQNLIRYHKCRFFDVDGSKWDKVSSYHTLIGYSLDCHGEGWRMIGVLRQFLKDNNIDIDAKRAEWRKQ